ncbi:helix-turn-helix transcriptional regulator [Paeniroseomonas aquatica]|uniref:AlpA family transcriptional regulator n=1 Tax=Paeniroseomonas aquatica TaxID=373043 RepID=A0ABT8AEN3_9PROT|nr:AlpA family transcriptional regulator [Paeniroseomonas aquatica]MDN3568003.1 AlpA family transcriptional regulator [Paeniroseomonas aquatica]
MLLTSTHVQENLPVSRKAQLTFSSNALAIQANPLRVSTRAPSRPNHEGASGADRILRQPEVARRTGLSRSSIYQRVKECHFPVPIALGERAVGWLESEIDGWITERIIASRPPS